jgi:uncharacterized protein YkwD
MQEGGAMDLRWSFDNGRSGFDYTDNLFENAYSGRYAHGWYSRSAGDGNDGGLIVRLGGQDDRRVSDMSGGWTRDFATDTPAAAELTFRYKLNASPHFEYNETAEVRVAVDGEALGQAGRDYIDRLRGDGNGGSSQSTGWQEVTLSLGTLEAGRHELDLGGFLNGKNARNEVASIVFDDVELDLTPVGAGDPDDGEGSGGDGDPEPDTGSGSDSALDAFEAEVLALTNAFRARNGVDPLESDARLAAAAEDWSHEMAEGDLFRHSDTSEQVEAEGYAWRALGENIAAGYSTPEAVVNGWISSPGHRRNMLSESFEDLGVGYVYQENDGGTVAYGHYWTQIFGTEKDALV